MSKRISVKRLLKKTLNFFLTKRALFISFRHLLSRFLDPIYGEPIAQSVEHLTFNQRVLGSSPSRLTILFPPLPSNRL